MGDKWGEARDLFQVMANAFVVLIHKLASLKQHRQHKLALVLFVCCIFYMKKTTLMENFIQFEVGLPLF